jgi:hypothetical protein
MDEPQMDSIRLQPSSIVKMVNDPEAHFILQSPKEVRAKRAALVEKMELGHLEGEVPEADESGLMHLVGLDLYSNGDVEDYTIDIHPGWLLSVKGVTPRAWESHQVRVGIDPKHGKPFQEVERQQVGETPRLVKYLMAAGVPIEIKGPGQYHMKLDTSEGPINNSEHIDDALPLLTRDSHGAEACCCGHAAMNHHAGAHVVELCEVCGPELCGLFHRHTEGEEDDRAEQAEEQSTP